MGGQPFTRAEGQGVEAARWENGLDALGPGADWPRNGCASFLDCPNGQIWNSTPLSGEFDRATGTIIKLSVEPIHLEALGAHA